MEEKNQESTESEKEKKKSGSKWFLMILLIVLMAGLVGGGVYIWNNIISPPNVDDELQIADLSEKTADCTQVESECNAEKNKLQEEISFLKSRLVSGKETGNSPYKNLSLPILVFNPPGLFSDTEKQELHQKVIDPFFDFYNEKKLTYVTLTIEKEEENPADDICAYTGFAIGTKDGRYAGFCIEKSVGKISWWVPTCMDGCSFSESFKQKYPEVVKLSE